ncbi:MAG: tRNA (guanine(46)-N(7))-methyltransferase TrmB [bacterium]
MNNPDIELKIEDIAFNPLNFKELFPNKKRVEIEIGFCSGLFLSEYANLNKETGILGLEISAKFFARGKRNLKRLLNQDNVKILCFDAIPVIKELIPFNSVDAFHIYFPDPWPKKKHHKFRTLRFENFLIFYNRLKKGGKVYIATDHPEYAEFISKEIEVSKEFFKTLPYGADDRTIKTKWEKKQIAECWNINYFLLEKK